MSIHNNPVVPTTRLQLFPLVSLHIMLSKTWEPVDKGAYLKEQQTVIWFLSI